MKNEKFGNEIIYLELDQYPTKNAICEVSNKENEYLYYRILDFEKIENGKYKTKMELVGKGKP